jgi:hypothetical protein
MDMKNEILEEINRMRVLGGILNEATSPTSILPSLIAKITRTSLDDTILKAFEVLEQRKVIAIDKAAKTLTKIDWQRLTDDELKLLFRAKPLRDALEEVVTKVGVDITSPAQRLTFKGNFKRIVNGYDDAAGSVITGGGSSTGGKVGTTVANVGIDVEQHVTKYFPNIASDKNIFNSLVNDIKPNLVNLDTKGQIDFITRKCESLERQIGENLQNLTNMDSKDSAEALKKGLNVVKVIKEKLKKYGPVSFSRTDKVKWLSTIGKTLAWVEATDILVGGYVESKKTGENLADTMVKRAGDRGAYVLGMFGSALEKLIGTTPKDNTNTEPQKEKIIY